MIQDINVCPLQMIFLLVTPKVSINKVVCNGQDQLVSMNYIVKTYFSATTAAAMDGQLSNLTIGTNLFSANVQVGGIVGGLSCFYTYIYPCRGRGMEER